jgi:polysaccharide biosynthesis protein PslL
MNKLHWIDLMKGIGILSVVAGHIYGGNITRVMYMFHMPLFFFLSGYLFKPNPDLKQYFKKKVYHLLLPYTAFLIPLYISFDSVSLHPIVLKEIIIYIIRPIIGGNIDGKGLLAVFWFVTCLFLTQQIMNYVMTQWKNKIVFIFTLTCLVLSYVNSLIFPSFWLPWKANVTLGAIPIFYIGYLYKTKPFKINDMLLLFLGVFIILSSFYFTENTYNMTGAKYGIPILTLVSSIVLILNIKYLSIQLSKIKIFSLLLSELGATSMVIMFMHQPIQIFTRDYITNNNTYRFLIATILAYLLYRIFCKFVFTRALFLGSEKDINVLKFYVNKYKK